MPLVGQRDERFAQHLERAHAERQVALLRAENAARYPDDVAEIERIEEREAVVAERIATHVELHAARAIPEVGPNRALTHLAYGHQPSRQRKRSGFGRGVGGEFGEAGVQIRGVGVHGKTRRLERIHALGLQRREVGAALRPELGLARTELVARVVRRHQEAFLTGFFLLIESIL